MAAGWPERLGVAPYVPNSGQPPSGRYVLCGYRQPRNALCMVALCAIRRVDLLRAFQRPLRDCGKEHKSAWLPCRVGSSS